MSVTVPLRAMPWIAPACAAALGLWQLGEPSLWVDEAFTASAIHQSYSELPAHVHWPYLTALKLWTTLVGTSEVALRLPSVAGAVLSVVLLYGLARRMFGTHVALVSSLLLALNPFVVKWSQQARGYTLLLALSIASTWLFVRAREREEIRRSLAYISVALLLVLWQFFSGVLLLAVHAFVARRSRRALLWLAPVAVIVAGRAKGAHGPGSPIEWLEYPSWFTIIDVVTDVPGGLGLGVILAALGVRSAEPHRELLVAWAALPFAISLVVSLFQPVFLDRYLIVSCPAFAILGALALVRGLRRLRRPAALAFAIATVVALALWYAPSGGDNWKGENWRAATASAMGESNGATVSPVWALPGYLYYGGQLRRSGLVVVLRRPGQPPPSRAYAAFGDKLWIVRSKAKPP